MILICNDYSVACLDLVSLSEVEKVQTRCIRLSNRWRWSHSSVLSSSCSSSCSSTWAHSCLCGLYTPRKSPSSSTSSLASSSSCSFGMERTFMTAWQYRSRRPYRASLPTLHSMRAWKTLIKDKKISSRWGSRGSWVSQCKKAALLAPGPMPTCHSRKLGASSVLKAPSTPQPSTFQTQETFPVQVPLKQRL